MNTEVPFAQAAQQLRLILGPNDLAEVAKNTGIAEQKLRDAKAGLVGLETEEIHKIAAGTRAQALIATTASERRRLLNKSAS